MRIIFWKCCPHSHMNSCDVCFSIQFLSNEKWSASLRTQRTVSSPWTRSSAENKSTENTKQEMKEGFKDTRVSVGVYMEESRIEDSFALSTHRSNTRKTSGRDLMKKAYHRIREEERKEALSAPSFLQWISLYILIAHRNQRRLACLYSNRQRDYL